MQSFDDVAPAVHDEWERLVEGMPNAVPFQTPAWIGACARQWPFEGASLRLLTAVQGGRLVAVLPLTLQRRRMGPLSLCLASSVCNPHMPLSEICIAPGHPSLLPTLLDWLLGASRLGIARLDLPGVAADAALGAALAHRRARHRVVPSSEAARVDTRMPYDALIKGVSSKHRSNLSRSIKRAEAVGALRYDTYRGEALLETGWPLLLEIEASGWKGRAGTAIGSDERLRRFYRDAAAGLDDLGRAHIGVLWFGDRPAAAALVLQAGRIAYAHKVGYREEWSAMSPGHLLMREIVQQACADDGIDAVSLVLHPPWSDVWRPVLTPVEHHSVFGGGWQGRFLWQATRLRERRAAAAAPAESPAEGEP